MKNYLVELEGRTYEVAEYEVTARTEKEAVKKAIAEFEKTHNFDYIDTRSVEQC